MKTLLALALTAAATVMAAPAAHASDHRPCVSKVEFQAVNQIEVKSRATIEAKWEVRNRAIHQPQFDTRGHYVMAYEACGYDESEVKILVSYRLKDNVADLAQRFFLVHGAKPHGKI